MEDCGDLIEAGLEFSLGGGRIGAYSPALVGMTVRRASDRIGTLDLRSMFSAAGRPGWSVAGTLFGVVAAIEIALFGADAERVIRSIGDPSASFRYPRRPSLVVTSGDRAVFPGDSTIVEAVSFGSPGGAATLHVSVVPGVWNRVEVKGDTLGAGASEVSAYRHVLRDIRDDVAYAFSAGGSRTREYRIGVIHRPVINRIAAVLFYPSYTGARPDTLDPLSGDIAAIAGTRVALAGETSKALRSARLRFSSGATEALRPAAGGFAGGFTVRASDTFVVDVVDSSGFANDHPVAYPVAALEDRTPHIELLAPEDGAQLARDLEAELLYRATDDYGVERVSLLFMREGKDDRFRETALDRPAAASVEIDGRSVWSLEEVGVFPGDRIFYCLEAADNNSATGPGVSRTPTRLLVVPSMSEIYARIHEEERRREDDLAGVLDDGRAIRDRLLALSEALKAEGNNDSSARCER